MKKIIYAFAIALLTLSACDQKHKDEPIPEDTYPSIHGQWPSGTPGIYNIALGGTLEIVMQFAPTKYAEGIWYVDDVEHSRGTKLLFTPEAVGVYQLRLEVSTKYHTTSRSAEIRVQNN